MSKETLFADGLETGFIGLAKHGNRLLAVYDISLIREHFASQGADPTDIEEHIDFNIRGAWEGGYTPVFVDRMSIEDAFFSLEG